MNIVNWNIKWGGLGKEEQIVEKLAKADADLIVLSEFKSNDSGHTITSKLKELGYSHNLRSSNRANKNGVGVFSRHKVECKSHTFTDKENVCTFSIDGIAFIGAFCADDSITATFVSDIEKMGEQKNTVIIGDLNTGPRGSKPDRYDDIDRILRCGYTDLWRAKHTKICWSFQCGKGKSQPDHALTSNDMEIEKAAIEFDLSPLADNISDHGIMMLTIGA